MSFLCKIVVPGAISRAYKSINPRRKTFAGTGEFSIVLGFKLTSNSDNTKKAAISAVQNALQNETVDQLLDLFFIETENWYDSIRKIENSLLYKK